MNIIENNKIIAEFMGLSKTTMFYNLKTGNYVKKENDDCDIQVEIVYLKNKKPITNFYYHSDWNWLMEVVEKIEKMKFGFEVIGNYCHIIGTYIYSTKKTKIEAVYLAVVEFIKSQN